MESFSPNSIIGWLIAALVFMGLAHVLLYAVAIFLRFSARDRTPGYLSDDPEGASSNSRRNLEGVEKLVQTLASDLSGGIRLLWNFARPILQFTIIVFVVYWFGNTIGFNPTVVGQFAAVDVKTVLAFFVIGAFCVGAFLSDNPAAVLKDLALVVIGFYFGTRAGP